MKNLYAPWRAGYLTKKSDSGKDQCVFCTKLAKDPSPESLIIYRNDHCAALLNRFPYSPGHLLIIPTKHLAQLQALDEQSIAAMWRLKQQLMTALKKTVAPMAIESGFSLGKVAGAGIPEHLHEHLVPRYQDDTKINFFAPPQPLNLLDFKAILLPKIQEFD